jgi:hypothetical protein
MLDGSKINKLFSNGDAIFSLSEEQIYKFYELTDEEIELIEKFLICQ